MSYGRFNLLALKGSSATETITGPKFWFTSTTIYYLAEVKTMPNLEAKAEGQQAQSPEASSSNLSLSVQDLMNSDTFKNISAQVSSVISHLPSLNLDFGFDVSGKSNSASGQATGATMDGEKECTGFGPPGPTDQRVGQSPKAEHNQGPAAEKKTEPWMNDPKVPAERGPANKTNPAERSQGSESPHGKLKPGHTYRRYDTQYSAGMDLQ